MRHGNSLAIEHHGEFQIDGLRLELEPHGELETVRLTSVARGFNVTGGVVDTRSSEKHPFTGEHVAAAGKLTLFSKRDLRTLVERLGRMSS